MKFLGKGGMSESEELKGQQGTDNFISKVVELGCRYHAFIPIVEIDGNWTVAAATVVGRPLSYDALNTSFVLVDYTVNELDQVRDISGLDRLARCSDVLYEAEYHRKLAILERDARQTAEDLRRDVDLEKLAIDKRELDLAYHGGKVNDKKILPTQNKVVGPVMVSGVSNLSLIKLRPDGSPDDSNPVRVAVRLSSTKISQFKSCLQSITDKDKERGYMECMYAYEGKTKQEAGLNAKFAYVDEAHWLQNMYPLWHKDHGTAIKNRLLYTQEAIAAKNKEISYTLSVDTIFVLFKEYMNKKAVMLFPYIDTEEESTKRAAKDLINYDSINSYEELRNKLLEMVGSEETVESESNDDTATAGSGTIAGSQDQVKAMDTIGAEAYDNAAAELLDDVVGEL